MFRLLNHDEGTDVCVVGMAKCLFDLILHVPVNNLSVMSGRVFLG